MIYIDIWLQRCYGTISITDIHAIFALQYRVHPFGNIYFDGCNPDNIELEQHDPCRSSCCIRSKSNYQCQQWRGPHDCVQHRCNDACLGWSSYRLPPAESNEKGWNDEQHQVLPRSLSSVRYVLTTDSIRQTNEAWEESATWIYLINRNRCINVGMFRVTAFRVLSVYL